MAIHTVLTVGREWTVVMMSRYIDADILLEVIEGLTWYHPVQGKMVEGANGTGWYKSDDIFKAIESVPSAHDTKRVKELCNSKGVSI